MNCIVCASELPARSGRGRPRRYCSAACRRSAELEIRRVDARLAELEGTLSARRVSPLAAPFDDPAAIETEITRQRDRLLALLGDQ